MGKLKIILPKYHSLGIPLYLWGRPSTGKTSAVRAYAQEKAEALKLKYSEDKFAKNIFTMKVLSLSQFDSPDLRGMPSIIDGITRFLPTDELPREGQGIIFFDEMNLADQSMRAAVMQLVLENRISNLILPSGFWRIAASNTENDMCDVNSTSLAMLRRFCHLGVKPDVDEVIEYLFRTGGDARVMAFLKANPQDLFPTKWDDKLLENKANPFPSSWETVSRMIEGEKDSVLMFDYAASAVGPVLAQKFNAFVKLASIVNLENLIKNPEEELEKMEVHKEKMTLLISAVYSLAHMWQNKKKILTPVALIKVSEALIKKEHPDLVTAFLMLIYKSRIRLGELEKTDGYEELMRKIGKFMPV